MKLKITAIIVVCILFIYGTTVKVSESNWACGTCHTAQYERWAVSTHQTIICRSCHIDPGISGAFDAQINGLQNLYVSITKGNEIQPHEDPLPISTENCTDCHAAILRFNELGYADTPEYNTLQGQGLLIAHRTHVEDYSIDCVECHRGIVHRNPEDIGKYDRNWPFMVTDCSPCHDGKYSERFNIEVTSLEDNEKCITCHPYIVPPTGDGIIHK